MEAFEVGLILSGREMSLTMRVLGLAPPEELAIPQAEDGDDEAFRSLEASGLMIRDERRLAVDRGLARLIEALCRREWALTVSSIARSRTAFGGGGSCVVLEGLSGGGFLLTPFPSAREALDAMAAELDEEQGALRACLTGAQSFELTLSAGEMRGFLAEAMTRTVEG